MADVLIEASGLRKTFADRHGEGGVRAVDGVDLAVAAGEIYGLVGSDGAGKTTTMRLLAGALKLDGGRAAIAGYDVFKQPERARTQLGYLSQRFSLYEDLTVLENIRFFAEVRGLATRDWRPRCMEILDFVGLAAFTGRLAGQLSGGMKQKLGLASAMVTRPRVLLLDEPTTGVDPVTRQDFWQLIIRLVASDERGVCVLVSTPYMDEAARCHRIGFMRQGRFIAEGTPGQLRATLANRIVELRGGPLPALRSLAAQDPSVDDVHTFGDRLHVRLKEPDAQAVIERLQAAIPAEETAATPAGAASEGRVVLQEARAIPPVLEDVFMALAHEED